MIGDASWERFLRRLRLLVPNGQACMSLRTASSGTIVVQSGMDEEMVASYGSYYSRINPWLANGDPPVGTIVHTDEIVDRHALYDTEFYADFLRPRDLTAAFGLNIRSDASGTCLLTLLSAPGHEASIDAVRRQIEPLVPHLQLAFERARAAGKSRHPHQLSGRLAAGGLLRLSRTGKVTAADETALELIAQSRDGFVIDRAGRLVCRDAPVSDAIGAALAGWGERTSFVRVTHLFRGPEVLPLRVTVYRPAVDLEAYFRGPECFIVLEDPSNALQDAVEAFGAMHGLTSAERRVVLGLARGLAPKQIAEAHGTSAETVRLQLKHVYARTGVRGQVDLVRHVFVLSGGSERLLQP